MRLNDLPLRPAQKGILAYQSGFMGVSAVPGSGKTFTLALLAAKIVASGELDEDQEVLIVTLVNSAVDNFYRRINQFIQRQGLLPFTGYRVRTLHGLANDIVRERPGLIQLDDQFQIIDEREAELIRTEASLSWLRNHPDQLIDYLNSETNEQTLEKIRREKLLTLVDDIARAVIRTAKDRKLSPEAILLQLDQFPFPLPLAQMGAEIYSDYQRGLEYRGAVDFDDLIRFASKALSMDPELLKRMQHRWPFIMEDEAQDSSRLQEDILASLAGKTGNWVRVGDPNQAIFETFTTASPDHLVRFLHRPEVTAKPLPNSGRSTSSIIELANYLVTWTKTSYPVPELRKALLSPPLIEPAPRGDPQPNPADLPLNIHFHDSRLTPSEEISYIANSIAEWLPKNEESTVAILAPRNKRGFEMAEELKRRGLPFVDSLLSSSSTTRYSAGALGHILKYLADPNSTRKLVSMFLVWRREERKNGKPDPLTEQAAELLRKIPKVEEFFSPTPRQGWLEGLRNDGASLEVLDILTQFREISIRWQKTILLPIDQLVLAISQDLFKSPAELAVAFKLSILLKHANQAHPNWRLPELSDELAVIARNERRFLGFSEDDSGFDPDLHQGKVIIATMHKAKGLEWDRVYLMSVNNYDFPSAIQGDIFIAEPWFIRDRLNLSAEALSQFETAFDNSEYQFYSIGNATINARLDYASERLRLLYVGITRARKDLIITWNSGRDGTSQPAIPFIALQSYWEGKMSALLRPTSE